MWIRADLKERAKNVLRKYYWIAFLVTLAAGILGGAQRLGLASNDLSLNFTYSFNRSSILPFGVGDIFSTNNFNFNDFNIDGPSLYAILMGLLIGGSILSAAVIFSLAVRYAIRIFLGGPLETGMNRYFLDARQDKSDFVSLFYSFKNGRYMNIVKAIAWRELFVFLWTLLFYIPGVIKGYAYGMIPYLLADNPNMDYKRAMILSMAMTDGEKWNMFVLRLSFIGWYLLGMLACYVGVFFVVPYENATLAELYVVLRQKAIDRGLCSADEVGQALPAAVV